MLSYFRVKLAAENAVNSLELKEVLANTTC